MNPTKFFWNTLACCIAILTLSIACFVWRSQEVNIKKAGWEVDLMVTRAEQLVKTVADSVSPPSISTGPASSSPPIIPSAPPRPFPTTRQSFRNPQIDNLQQSLDKLKSIRQQIPD